MQPVLLTPRAFLCTLCNTCYAPHAPHVPHAQDEIDSLAPQRGAGATGGGEDAAGRRLLTELLLQVRAVC